MKYKHLKNELLIGGIALLVVFTVVLSYVGYNSSSNFTANLFSSNTVSYNNNCGNYNDIYASDPSCWLYSIMRQRNIFTGDANGNFRPYDSVNRAEFTKILITTLYGNKETLNSYTTNADLQFRDLHLQTDWYYPYLKIAKNKGLISGYPDGTFRPGNQVTRAEFAKMLYSKLPNINSKISDAKNYMYSRHGNQNPYKELGFEANQWYSDWLILLYYSDSWGSFLDYCDAKLCPDRPITRKEIAAAVDKLNRAFAYEYGFNDGDITNQLSANNCLNITRLNNMTATLQSLGIDTGIMAKCYNNYRSIWQKCTTLWDWKKIQGTSGLSQTMENHQPQFTNEDAAQCASKIGQKWHFEIDYEVSVNNCRRIRNLPDRTSMLQYLNIDTDVMKQCADTYRDLWENRIY
jgi:hypothetical protein